MRALSLNRRTPASKDQGARTSLHYTDSRRLTLTVCMDRFASLRGNLNEVACDDVDLRSEPLG